MGKKPERARSNGCSPCERATRIGNAQQSREGNQKRLKNGDQAQKEINHPTSFFGFVRRCRRTRKERNKAPEWESMGIHPKMSAGPKQKQIMVGISQGRVELVGYGKKEEIKRKRFTEQGPFRLTLG